MRRTALFLTAAALVVGAANLSAQAPNFAGHWMLVVDPNATPPAGRGGGGLGADVTITQDASTLTTTRTTQNGPVATVYKLDGTDSKNMMAGRGGNPGTEVISHAKWDGAKLVVSTTRNMGGNDVTTTMTLSVDGAGNLVVQNTRPGQDGTPVTTTQTYKKS